MTDYIGWNVGARIRKAVRYSGLYGIRRTIGKIRAQYHMRATGAERWSRESTSGDIGIIGAGNFAFSNIAYYARRNFGRCIRGVMDPHLSRASSLARVYKARYSTTDAREIIDDDQISTIFIASNHSSHAEYAIEALEQGKVVHIEKPHVTSLEQLERLWVLLREPSARVRLGFNRPESRLGIIVRDALAAQKGPALYNWFIAGHAIDPEHWYFSEAEGGRILGNLCHWTDFVLQCQATADLLPMKVSTVSDTTADNDWITNIVFGDGSIACISFSAKGHAFEGVRERLNAHKGDLLLSLDDFRDLRLDIGWKIVKHRLRHRDHGHERAIVDSIRLGRGELATRADPIYVWNSAILFLAVRESMRTNSEIQIVAQSDGRGRIEDPG